MYTSLGSILCTLLLVAGVRSRDVQIWELHNNITDTHFGGVISVPLATGCSIAINGRNVLPVPQPLLIRPGTNQFLQPETRNGVLNLFSNQPIELFCSGAGFGSPFNGAQTLIATCLSHDDFIVNGRPIKFAQLRCIVPVEHVARRSNRSQRNLCATNVTQIEVGFQANGRFLWTMEICHDEVLESTQFSYYPQGPANTGFQRSVDRPNFIGGIFFGGRNVDHLYTGVAQRNTIGGIIGPAQVARLWDDSRDFFLARGHLAARSDFIFESQQRTSFYLMNAAPQWHSFNSGNWERIETSVQNFLSRRNIQAEIFTGTFGVQDLPDAAGIRRPLFLSFDRNGRGRIPVPRFYYKIVIGERSRRGVAFVGVNNPHATMAQVRSGAYRLCNDVSAQIDYVNWNQTNLAMGYSYACDVNEFATAVRHLPASVRTVGLLV